MAGAVSALSVRKDQFGRKSITEVISDIDLAFAPGTGTPVVGGLTSMEAQQILRGLKSLNIKSADVVEVAPAHDVSAITALAAATIAVNCLALIATAKKNG
nr:arginase family protein [Kordiimonas aquimaris]